MISAGRMQEPIQYLYVSSSFSSAANNTLTYTSTGSAWAYVSNSSATRTQDYGSNTIGQVRKIWVDDPGNIDFDNVLVRMRAVDYKVTDVDSFTIPGIAILSLTRHSAKGNERLR
jgi:hypothetical protein